MGMEIILVSGSLSHMRFSQSQKSVSGRQEFRGREHGLKSLFQEEISDGVKRIHYLPRSKFTYQILIIMMFLKETDDFIGFHPSLIKLVDQIIYPLNLFGDLP